MSDLKTFFDNPVLSSVDPAGDPASRGSDPNVDLGGSASLMPNYWDNKPVPVPGGEESSNSMSGLPARPSRMSPSPAEPPGPPDLTDHTPGMIKGS